MPRLFAAIEIPPDIATHLSCLRGGLAGACWIEAENYHITLQFFGDVTPLVADEIVTALAQVKSSAFCINLKNIEIFTVKKPSRLYAGVAPCAALRLLHERVHRKTRQLELERDKLSFIPHVTLARLRHVDVQGLAAYLERHATFTTPAFMVKSFVLMSARQSLGGGPYFVEEKWQLEEEEGTGRVGAKIKS